MAQLADDDTYEIPGYYEIPPYRYTLDEFRAWGSEAAAIVASEGRYPPEISNYDYCGYYDAGGVDIVLFGEH
jgi:hypothetical protein